MSPVAPGTMGSLATTLLLGLIFYGGSRAALGLTATGWNLMLAGGVILFGGLCVAQGRWTV